MFFFFTDFICDPSSSIYFYWLINYNKVLYNILLLVHFIFSYIVLQFSSNFPRCVSFRVILIVLSVYDKFRGNCCTKRDSNSRCCKRLWIGTVLWMIFTCIFNFVVFHKVNSFGTTIDIVVHSYKLLYGKYLVLNKQNINQPRLINWSTDSENFN